MKTSLTLSDKLIKIICLVFLSQQFSFDAVKVVDAAYFDFAD